MQLTPYQAGYTDGFLQVERRSQLGKSTLERAAYNHGYSVGTREREKENAR